MLAIFCKGPQGSSYFPLSAFSPQKWFYVYVNVISDLIPPYGPDL
jgi:hypothetical protein